MDFSSYMTVTAALQFREDVGGEEAIMSYTHQLAIDGGRYIANVLGTEVLQDDDQIANLVDVRLPLSNPDNVILSTKFWIDTMLVHFPHTFVPAHKHGGKWWIRISAQIYNDLTDFDALGEVITRVCHDINGRN
ncbi:hypothetical protein HA402_012420 [Bradysia odoriphaga]|nr:hypothetical protein HA402_012420 [Bradysia odoriphaga]